MLVELSIMDQTELQQRIKEINTTDRDKLVIQILLLPSIKAVKRVTKLVRHQALSHFLVSANTPDVQKAQEELQEAKASFV